LTSASRPQASHLAVTARTPFKRMFASVIGGPKLFLPVMRAAASPRGTIGRNINNLAEDHMRGDYEFGATTGA
jgi:hypothetical protein